MKNIIILAISLFVLCSTAKAQRTVSLRQHYSIIQTYRNSPDPVAAGLDEGDDITYVQDVNNELNQFVGTWKGTNSNRSYEVIFVKKIGYRLFAADELR